MSRVGVRRNLAAEVMVRLPPCPPPNGALYPTPEQAAVGAAQRASADQHAGGHDDNRERSFRLVPAPGGMHSFVCCTVGRSEEHVDIVATLGDEGAGHTHLAGGGDRLSRSSDGLPHDGFRGDLEQIGDLLDGLSELHQNVDNFVTVLVTSQGDVVVWYGRGLTARGRTVGNNRCTRAR